MPGRTVLVPASIIRKVCPPCPLNTSLATDAYLPKNLEVSEKVLIFADRKRKRQYNNV
jgi:hypothetical protein